MTLLLSSFPFIHYQIILFVRDRDNKNNPMNLECFVEDLFLGGQWSIILGYRRLSVKSLLVHDLTS